MDFIEVYLLNQLDLSIDKRHYAKNLILEHHYPCSKLISLIKNANTRQKLCLLCFCDTFSRTNKVYFIKAIDQFIKLSKVENNETNKRSLSNLFLTFLNIKKQSFSHEQENEIIEICFSWLITDSKVATKCNCISCLSLLSKKHDWIADALYPLIEQMYPSMPVSFQSRARKVLEKR